MLTKSYIYIYVCVCVCVLQYMYVYVSVYIITLLFNLSFVFFFHSIKYRIYFEAAIVLFQETGWCQLTISLINAKKQRSFVFL